MLFTEKTFRFAALFQPNRQQLSPTKQRSSKRWIVALAVAANLASMVSVSAVTAASTPSAPLSLTGVAGDSKATLAWQPPTSDGGSPILGYNIFKDGSFLLSTKVVLTYTVTGLTNGVTYRFSVSAFNAYGGGTHSSLVYVTPKATTSVTSSPSGQAMPIGDLPGFHQIFTDDFLVNVPLGSFPDAVSTKWSAHKYPWTDTTGNGEYDPHKTISIANGMMDLWIHTGYDDGGAWKHLVAAPMVAPGGVILDQLYGRYAVRFRITQSAPRYKTAWLLWPKSNCWPRDGEIDFPEGNLDGYIKGYVHHQGTAGSSCSSVSPSDQDWYATTQTYTTWHTAIIEWKPSDVKFYLDGTLVGHSTSRIENTPMHWTLQTETWMTKSEPPLDSTQTHVQIDWVSVWSYIG